MSQSILLIPLIVILIISLLYIAKQYQDTTIKNAVESALSTENTHFIQKDIISSPPPEVVLVESPTSYPPTRKYFNPAIPINVPTRGPAEEYQQVGVLTNADNSKILALYGRPTFTSSHKWNYFTTTDRFHQIRLPVHCESKNCTAEFGCDELYEGDSVNIPQYDETFKVSVYELEKPRYIPIV